MQIYAFVATYCKSPTTKHGNFTPSLPTYRAGTTVSLMCDVGYEPVSDVNATCDKRGVWDPSFSNCIAGKDVYVV